MRRVAHPLLRLICCFALLLAMMPARASVVCVSGGRVVADCPMAVRGLRPKTDCAEMAVPKRSCCHQSEARAACANGGTSISSGMHCELARVVAKPVLAQSTSFVVVLPQSALLAAPLWIPLLLPLVEEGRTPIVGTDSDPPPKRPRAPDRGRAPPIAA